MCRRLIAAFAVIFAASVQAAELTLEAEVLEATTEVQLPALSSHPVQFLVLHHKHDQDQANLAAWLRQHGGAQVAFQTLDGTVHQAVLQRLKHCFGRGLLLYTDPVRLKEKDVIRLQLATQ